MTNNLKFRVEAADEDVVVTLDGTNYMVRYYKADNEAGLKLFHTRGDERALAHASSPTQKQKSWVGSPKSELFLEIMVLWSRPRLPTSRPEGKPPLRR
jgi:hypothetical protein